MRKLFVFLTGALLFMQQGYSQQRDTVWIENFDNPSISFSATSSTLWLSDAAYSLPNTVGTASKSYLGLVPSRVGDTSELITPVYDCSNYEYVVLRFSHICKISPRDIARIEYREHKGGGVMGPWQVLPAATYLGTSTSYRNNLVFSAAAYSEWQAGDSTVYPALSWWQGESFDLQHHAGYAEVQFRFFIQHGSVAGTHVSYGWLLDNFEVLASTEPIKPPTVQFVSPFVRDAVYNTGPFEINAKVKTNSTVPLETPYLKYTATLDGVFVQFDSISMDMVRGDSLWKAIIPQLKLGMKVNYSITGKDIVGNSTTIYSEFVIKAGFKGDIIIQDGGTSTGVYPFHPSYGYARSMLLFTNDEIGTSATGAITSIGMRVSTASSGYIPTKIWLKTVPASQTAWTGTAASYFWATETQGATLVYNGNVSFSPTGWVDIPLSQNFSYSAKENLVVMFEQNCPTTSCSSYSPTYPYFYYKTLTTNRYWEKYSDNAGPDEPGCGTVYSYIYAYRPDFRINVMRETSDSNSVAAHSIDMADTIPTSPTTQVPIVVTIKNKGIVDLDSVTVYYSVNGGTAKDSLVKFSPALPWDYNAQITLGTYMPRLNGYDTIAVWVSKPNNEVDSNTSDDLLRKRIYGCPDMRISFVKVPASTVYTTGPHEVTARITTFSGAAVNNVTLYFEHTLSGTTEYDSATMLPQGNDLWTTEIPNIQYLSNVVYRINKTDALGNTITVSGSYYIDRITAGATNTGLIVGTGTVTSYYYPVCLYYDYSWSRQIYLASELNGSMGLAGATISRLAWYYNYTTAASKASPSQKCYLKAVDEAVCVTGYLDPVADGATLVYSGAISATASVGWKEVTFNTSFILPRGKNLMVYWVDQAGTYNGSSSSVWNMTGMPTNMTVYAYADGTFPSTSAGTLTANRPNARFNITPRNYGTSSASMDAIVSPTKSENGGTTTPVLVRIRNKGTSPLTTCTINWTLNGTLKTPVTYTKTPGLSEDFTDTITIGDYISSMGKGDQIVVWVSSPNGATDAIREDDTLRIIATGCTNPMPSFITVGTGRDFPTINSALDGLRSCGVTGDVTLELRGTFKENLDVSNLSEIMGNYHLTITSEGNNPANAIIQPSSSAAATLNNTRNLTLEGLTLGRITNAHVVQFTGACTNIVIRNCNLLGDTVGSTASTGPCPLYKASGGIVDSFFLINCLVEGGYYNAYFYGSNTTAGQYNTNIVFDSNTFQNAYLYAIYPYYTYFKSISYNKLTSRAVNATTYWYGLRTYYCNIDKVVGNHIRQRTSTYSYPMYFYYTQRCVTPTRNTMLVANNEIIATLNTSGYYGIYDAYSGQYGDIHYLNNSIHIGGTSTGANYGIYMTSIDAGSMRVVKNNLISIASNAGDYPIYLGTAFSTTYYDIDANNMYALNNVGYAGGARTTIGGANGWQSVVTTDRNSVSVQPSFANTANGLKLTEPNGLICPAAAGVTEDIDGSTRGNILTTMGCYEGIVFSNLQAGLFDLLGLRQGSILGQRDQVEVVVTNVGNASITSIKLGWSVDGVTQTPPPPLYTVPLLAGQSATLPVGTITYPGGDVVVKVWIESINGGLDDYQGDDTIGKKVPVCTIGYSGTFVIGSSASSNYKSLQDAFDNINVCGVSGDITLAYETGVYTDALNFVTLPIPSCFGTYRLTITSVTGNAADVVFRPSGSVAITLGNTKNLTIKAITADGAANSYHTVQFTNACTNVVIRDCRLLNSTTTSSSYGVIYKGSGTGVCVDVSFINNTMDGGYYGLYFYGGTGTSALGKNIVFDSNTVTNQYYYAVYPYYTNMKSISYNTILSRSSDSYTYWVGIYMYYSNGHIIANHIQQRTNNITYPTGIYLNYYNNSAYSQDTGLIANNEIILVAFSSTSSHAGIYLSNSRVKIIHNSIRVGGSGSTNTNPKGVSIAGNASDYVYMRNNTISVVAASTLTYAAYPIYIGTAGYLSCYDFNYNNLYNATTLGNYAGYYNGSQLTIANWRTQTGQDANSVQWNATYVSTTNNLDLTTAGHSNASSNCTAIVSEVPLDINGRVRISTANGSSKGAFEKPYTSGYLDMMAVRIPQTETEVVNNQSVSLDIEVKNGGSTAITSATFGWSLNGIPQPNSIPYTFPTALASAATTTIPLSTFTATGNIGDPVTVSVWIDTINGVADAITWNNTASARYVIKPLAQFVAPFVADTIPTLSFDVSADIVESSGATLTPPKMYIQTTLTTSMNETLIFDDSVTMVKRGGVWVAPIPQQYFGSKVVYWLPINDNYGNSVLLKDSTYIQFMAKGIDSVIIGTGTTTTSYNPYFYNYNHSYTRNYYMSYEIDPMQRGGYITSIAFNSSSASSVANITFYLKAVTDSINTSTAYIDPLADGATQVWGQATAAGPAGWLTFQFNNPFYLPPNMNLLVYCDNKNGSYSSQTAANFYYTVQNKNTSLYVYYDGTAFNPPTVSINPYLTTNRPNIKIKMLSSGYYTGNDLAIISVLSPVNRAEDLCEASHSAVKVAVSNLGTNDYDFSKDSVSIDYEIYGSQQTIIGSLSLNSGVFKGGLIDTFELITAMPLLAGTYDMKFWVSSPLDNIPYDDTIVSTYVSGKVGIPLDEDFSSMDLPLSFTTAAGSGSSVFDVFFPDTNVLKPNTGTGVLRFAGTPGSEAVLATRQIDIYGAIKPQLGFWYYHDSTTAATDMSYIMVNVIADGVTTTELTVYKRDKLHGRWEPYMVDLNPYAWKQCVVVQFIAMNGIGGEAQYIDRIIIDAQQNLAVDAILIDPIGLCDFQNKEIKAAIRNTSAKRISYTENATQLNVEVWKGATLVNSMGIPLDAGAIEAYEADTIPFFIMDFDTGTYRLTAWLANSIDLEAADDTTRRIVVINPDIEITAIANTNPANCVAKEIKMTQTVILHNKGNFDLYDIPFTLEIYGRGVLLAPAISDTLDVLLIGSSQTKVFSQPYEVPAEDFYNVVVKAELNCDAIPNDNFKNIQECVDLRDIKIGEIITPGGPYDNVGAAVNLEVRVINMSEFDAFANVVVRAIVSSSKGNDTLSQTIGNLLAKQDSVCRFAKPYIVPEVDNYSITVFLDRRDLYLNNDTARTDRTTNNGMANIAKTIGFALGQNIPNPAKSNTLITYNLPEDGQVIFTVYTIAGQTLHIEKKDAFLGNNELEFNTINLANGIYYYSMEYKGERLVKKMIIQK